MGMGNLETLSERHREMVRMEVGGKGRKAIAEALGMNADVVGRLLLHDELVEGYRQELVKERERVCKKGRMEAELWIREKVKELVGQLYKIAFYGETDGVKLQATVKALQVAGVKFDGVEEKMLKAPRIVIRDSMEKVEGDGLKKATEEVVE